MLKIEPFSSNDFQQLIDWIPDSSFALQWGGPAFTYPLTIEQLENYVSKASTLSDDILTTAQFYHDYVFKSMKKIRAISDNMEKHTSIRYWPYPSYGDMLFSI